MKGYVKIGTAAIRSPQGEFLPAEPIYREERKKPAVQPDKAYIPEDELLEILASKCKKLKKETSK